MELLFMERFFLYYRAAENIPRNIRFQPRLIDTDFATKNDFGLRQTGANKSESLVRHNRDLKRPSRP